MSAAAICCRHGRSPYSRHTSATLALGIPSSGASSRLGQCVTRAVPAAVASPARSPHHPPSAADSRSMATPDSQNPGYVLAAARTSKIVIRIESRRRPS
jgi:hypothetical protein